MVYDFSHTPMHQIIETLKAEQSEEIYFQILNPDLGSGHYAGEEIVIDGKSYYHHNLKSWCSLAELLGYRMLTPSAKHYPLISVTFKSCNP